MLFCCRDRRMCLCFNISIEFINRLSLYARIARLLCVKTTRLPRFLFDGASAVWWHLPQPPARFTSSLFPILCSIYTLSSGWDPIVLPMYIHGAKASPFNIFNCRVRVLKCCRLLGTEQVYPQDENNQLLSWKPQKGARVHVTVGDAVDGSALLAEVSQTVVRASDDTTLWDHGDVCAAIGE
jgi:hypothetical protein